MLIRANLTVVLRQNVEHDRAAGDWGDWNDANFNFGTAAVAAQLAFAPHRTTQAVPRIAILRRIRTLH
jgi:hypothetical protein